MGHTVPESHCSWGQLNPGLHVDGGTFGCGVVFDVFLKVGGCGVIWCGGGQSIG